MYDLTLGEFRTPHGHAVRMWVRSDTSDWNTCYSALNEDEYGLADQAFSTQALDVGAHIGSVSVGLAIDNPELHIVAIEAVPPNVELMLRNLKENGVERRVTVIAAAAGKGSRRTVHWGFEGDETATHHAFIGNALLVRQPIKHRTAAVPVVTLAKLVEEYGPFDFCKIDCEGCEADFLRGQALKEISLIRGEWHPPTITADTLGRTLATAGFTVTFSGPVDGPGGFAAVRQ